MKSELPAVSVILPAHNAQLTLEAAVTSVLEQTHQDFELIVLNDGSNDATACVGQRLAAKDSRVKYYEHESIGLVATLNRGLGLATAPIIARMDADDIALPQRFERQLQHLAEHEDIVLVGGHIVECSSDMEPIREIRLPIRPDAARDHLMILGNAFAHPTVMFRKLPVVNVGGYNPFFKHAEDYALWLELARIYKLTNVDDLVLKYRKSGSSVSSKHLMQQVVSELCARQAANRGRTLNEFRDRGCADVSTLLALGGSVTDLERIFKERGGSADRWHSEFVELARSDGPNSHGHRMISCGKSNPQSRLRVSALLPAYNHAKYILDAIESSLLCEEVEEVLVVDDGSSDDTLAVIEQATKMHPRVRNIAEHPRVNMGAHERLNQLVQAARCPIVAVLNTDDMFCATRFEGLAERFENGLELAFGNLLIIDEHNKVQWTKLGPHTTNKPFPPDLDVHRSLAAGDLITLLCHQNFSGTTSNYVFTRELWRRIGGIRNYRYVHDWDFLLRACVQGQVAYIPRFFSCYRIHSSNTIAESAAKVESESATMLKNVLEQHRAQLPSRAINLINDFSSAVRGPA